MRTSHLPFPMPERKFSLQQNWVDLTFMHWEVDPDVLRKHIPDDLEIELFEGKAYVGVIPFKMEKVRPRNLPSISFISNFPEFNIRTYVRKDGKGGVFFLTLDAQSHVTCAYAPFAYGLPYKYSKCSLSIDKNGFYSWDSKRNSNSIKLTGVSKPRGPLLKAKKGSLEEFLFERYCLYVCKKGITYRAYTCHEQWEFQDAEAELIDNSLTDFYRLGIKNSLKPDLIHFSKGVEVLTWNIESTVKK
ncbi:DUF2071 domain-containing protein [Euryarchaeota archaeon]|mgnify:FL=1|nr:DUF2071 domain-containing protein [Euryarchaeota archaeon]